MDLDHWEPESDAEEVFEFYRDVVEPERQVEQQNQNGENDDE